MIQETAEPRALWFSLHGANLRIVATRSHVLTNVITVYEVVGSKYCSTVRQIKSYFVTVSLTCQLPQPPQLTQILLCETNANIKAAAPPNLLRGSGLHLL